MARDAGLFPVTSVPLWCSFLYHRDTKGSECRNTMKFRFLFSLLLLLCFLGCSHDENAGARVDQLGQRRPLGVLPSARISLSSKLTSLDVVLTQPQPSIVTIYLTAGRLFRVGHDWQVEPELADSMIISEDGLTVTVTLKENLVYSDRTPVLAEDVVFAYERNRDVPGAFFAPLLSSIKEVKSSDERTVVFTLSAPYLDLPVALAHMSMGIHPKNKIEEDPDYFRHPVSAGPYVIKDWIPGSSRWTIEENPTYVRGPMAIRRLEFLAVPDQTSRVLQLASGTLDYVYDLPVMASSVLPPQVETYSAPLNGQHHIAFNLGLPKQHPLRDPDVRHAISLAIDREAINEKAFGGISPPARGFQYSGSPESLHNLPFGGKRNLKAAKERLARTPFAEGFDVSLQTYGQRMGWTEAALVIAEDLSELGLRVQVQPVEDAVAGANLRAGQYEMIFSGNASGPMNFFRNQFVPGAFWTDVIRYRNPRVARLVDLAFVAKIRQERIDFLHEAQRLALEDMPLVPVSERVVLVGNRIGRKILFEANHPPGTNPAVATLADLKQEQGKTTPR